MKSSLTELKDAIISAKRYYDDVFSEEEMRQVAKHINSESEYNLHDIEAWLNNPTNITGEFIEDFKDNDSVIAYINYLNAIREYNMKQT